MQEQLDWLSGNGHSDLVEFVILSGGLGSSTYVRDRIQQHLASFPYPNAPRADVIPCQDPQLVVPYTASRHPNEHVVNDPFDSKKLWAVDQIQWLIRKGDNINPNDPLVKTFEIHLAEQDMTRSWDADIVVSQNEIGSLPHGLSQAGVTKLCQIKSNLDGVQQHQLVLKQKRGTCFRRGYRFYICRFDVGVVVAPADLRFELWFGDQRFLGEPQAH
ncbi:hypothetical protein G6O67_005608 [Ophiocordyceps sinensis]|uniref:Uncharacterized protein n=1 Tax=Ophiocordyceps sinensis TaxID=72228 RepID=A0A8H4LWS2_9HYPO|nr:hypothetical protein G6O67_005608 [Ophiocordyceps sinensis]